MQTIYGNGEGDFGTHRFDSFPPVFDNVPVILLPKDAILHWKFDNLDGIDVIDSSGFETMEWSMEMILVLIFSLTTRLKAEMDKPSNFLTMLK